MTAEDLQLVEGREEFSSFVEKEIVPFADLMDQQQRWPKEWLDRLRHSGYLGASLPLAYGGKGFDWIKLGLLHEQVGRACSSVRSLFTVHEMVGQAILRWGARAQRDYWLPRLASGELLAAFALSEPLAGSDASSLTTTASRVDDHFVVEGVKQWVSFGQVADLFLVFAMCNDKPLACLIPRESKGVAVQPITDMMGCRSSMLAEVHLEACVVPAEHIVGRVGFGLSHVAGTALDHGRYSVAWGCVGILQACLDAAASYALRRRQGGRHLADYQLIQRLIADIKTDLHAARALCMNAGRLKNSADYASVIETSMAKYFASTKAAEAAKNALQIHGAHGCSNASSAQRIFRDAQIMEIIEGSSQIQQLTIAREVLREYQALQNVPA